MASAVEIANRALTKLGAARITDLADDSPEARSVSAAFSSVRDAELRAHPWGFALHRRELAALTDAPAYGYARQFQLPADYLALYEVADMYAWSRHDPPVPWQVEGRRILTSLAAPLRIRYIRRVEITIEYDALFVDALAARLAYELCEEITQSSTKRQLADADYARAIREARRVNAIERPPTPLPEGSWIIERLAGW